MLKEPPPSHPTLKEQPPGPTSAIAARVAGAYLLLGVAWIFGSDLLVETLAPETPYFPTWQTYKGWTYVAVTGFLLYLTLTFLLRRLDKERLKRFAARQRHEEVLRKSEKQYRQLVENVQDVIYSGRFHSGPAPFRLTYTSRPQTIFGHSLDELLERPELATGAIHPDDLPVIVSSIEALRKGENDERRIRIWVHESEEYRWFENRLVPEFNNAGKVIGFFGVARDITDRIQADQAQRLSHRIIEASSQGLIITDATEPDNPIITVNEAFEKMTGYTREEALGRSCGFLAGPESDPAARAELALAARENRSALVETLNYRKDGSTFWANVALFPVSDPNGDATRFVITQTDVSKFKTLEAQFRQAQKMEVVGQLASGVAHNFNNLLGVILGYADLAKVQLEPGSVLRDYLQEITMATNRAASLPRQLLAFARKEAVSPSVFDLHELLRETTRMIERLIGSHITIECRFCKNETACIKADPGQIEQVILNLAVNARDAMPDGGTLTIETDILDSADACSAPFLDCPGIRISVTDTGLGMDEELLEHIFEPFFTTKEEGRGTGLGLATCKQTVEALGGRIVAKSRLGHGSIFSIFLPHTAHEAPSSDDRPEGEVSLSGDENLLIVEDETSLRELSSIYLQDLGYTVLQATNGRNALHLLQNADRKVDLVITDLVMPEMGGGQFYETLRETWSDLPILFASGNADNEIMRTCKQSYQADLIHKPFTPAMLATRIRRMLDQPARNRVN